MDQDLIEWAEFNQAFRELGDAFVRILVYYREDGYRSVEAIEKAMEAADAAALVIPAHTLKGGSRQFGARAVGDMAEIIEATARDCVEMHRPPYAIAATANQLRLYFTRTLNALEEAVSRGGGALPTAKPAAMVSMSQAPVVAINPAAPLVKRAGGFGRKGISAGASANPAQIMGRS